MPKNVLKRKQIAPIGTVQPLAGDTIPSGYLVCDGSIVNIADYPSLYNVIGIAHGHGNNDGLTFHLPDLRGRFVRGQDDSAGRDGDSGSRTAGNAGGNVGDAIGSVQDDRVKSHNHNYSGIASGDGTSPGGGTYPMFDASNNGSVNTTTLNTTNGAGGDTRPTNINVKYIIKAS